MTICVGVGLPNTWRKAVVWVAISAIILTICLNMIFLGIHTRSRLREVYCQVIVSENVTKLVVGVNNSSVPGIKVDGGVTASSVSGIKVGDRVTSSSVPVMKVVGGVTASSVPSMKVDGGVATSSVPSMTLGGGVTASSVPLIKVGGGVAASTEPVIKVGGGVTASSVPLIKVSGGVAASTEPVIKVGGGVTASSVPVIKVGGGVAASTEPVIKVGGGVIASSVPVIKVSGGLNASSVPVIKANGGVNASSVPVIKARGGVNASSVPVMKKIQTEVSVDDANASKVKLTHRYELANRVNKKCNNTQYAPQVKVFGNYKSGDINMCFIWKVGTTFIRRLFMLKNVPAYSGLTNPYDINFEIESGYLLTISNDPSQSRFMFVRNPYKRLLSGYIDKLVAPNPVFWRRIAVPAIRLSRAKPSNLSLTCGHDLTFNEYVKYVIKAEDPAIKTVKPDGHFERMTSLCKPCSVKYDFVGRMETFAEDSLELARRLNLSNQTLHLLKETGEYFAWIDAMKDTVHQPFAFRKGYISCISFKDALERSWRKLQMRGLIDKMPFPVKDVDISSLTEEQFLEMALQARSHSSSEERKLLQHNHYKEMYSTISEEDIEQLKRIYKEDFELFEYNDQSPNTPNTV